MPSLEVRNARGQWETAIANIGFPSGKDKTIVIDLAGRFPTADHRVRIRTTMQIYWDQAFVAADASESTSPAPRVTGLRRVSAALHFRGYSRMYRTGGRHGPHWFDYQDVSKDSPWRVIEGSFTRFGDVLPLPWVMCRRAGSARSCSTPVEPLPLHAIEQYPYAAGESYPKDSAHVRSLQKYNTRVIGRQ